MWLNCFAVILFDSISLAAVAIIGFTAYNYYECVCAFVIIKITYSHTYLLTFVRVLEWASVCGDVCPAWNANVGPHVSCSQRQHSDAAETPSAQYTSFTPPLWTLQGNNHYGCSHTFSSVHELYTTSVDTPR